MKVIYLEVEDFLLLNGKCLRGKNNIQFSLIRLNDAIDGGNIIMKKLIKFRTTDTFNEIKKNKLRQHKLYF